jgi:PP-loop superfamily ATP-utilizing enzyme
MVEEIETFLRQLGFALVRVRLVSPVTVCIEVARDEIEKAFDLREAIAHQSGVRGLKRVALDLEGHQQGKINGGV